MRVDVSGRIRAHCRQLVVKVVPVEQGLYRVPSEQQHVVLELFVFKVLPFLVDVLLVEVVSARRYERSLDLPIDQILPGIVSQPWVRLHFGRSVQPQAIHRLPLNHFVYKIRSLDTPASRDISPFDLYLLRKNVVPDLFPRLPNIGPLRTVR